MAAPAQWESAEWVQPLLQTTWYEHAVCRLGGRHRPSPGGPLSQTAATSVSRLHERCHRPTSRQRDSRHSGQPQHPQTQAGSLAGSPRQRAFSLYSHLLVLAQHGRGLVQHPEPAGATQPKLHDHPPTARCDRPFCQGIPAERRAVRMDQGRGPCLDSQAMLLSFMQLNTSSRVTGSIKPIRAPPEFFSLCIEIEITRSYPGAEPVPAPHDVPEVEVLRS